MTNALRTVASAEIVREAREWVGTPFHHQAYVKGAGCDCIGLVAGIALHFDLPGAQEWRSRPEFHNYTRQPDPKLLLRGCDDFLLRADVGQVRLADILLMRFDSHPMHFAIVSSLFPLYVIHSLSLLGGVCEHALSGRWRSNVYRAYRYHGVA